MCVDRPAFVVDSSFSCQYNAASDQGLHVHYVLTRQAVLDISRVRNGRDQGLGQIR